MDSGVKEILRVCGGMATPKEKVKYLANARWGIKHRIFAIKDNGAARAELEGLRTGLEFVELELEKQKGFLDAGAIEQIAEMIEETANRAARKVAKSEEFQTGKKVKAGGRKGHEKQYGDRRAKQSRWAEWQAFINKRHADYPGHTFNALTRAAAVQFSVAQRTIYRRCKNP